MSNNIKIDKIIIHECNILADILNPTKRAKSKYNNYSPIQQGCINTCSGRELFRKFRILLNSRSISTIITVEMTSKLKPKKSTDTMWEIQAGKFTTSKKVNVDFRLP